MQQKYVIYPGSCIHRLYLVMITAVFLALCPDMLSAGEANYQPYILGLRAPGMGGAVSADAEGMDACYYNPAGLANSRNGSISASASLYGVQTSKKDDSFFPGEDLTTDTLATIPSGLSMIFPCDERLKLAFSVFVPMQISAKEIKSFSSGDKEHYYNYANSLQVFLIGPSVGYKATDRLNLGASLYCAYTSSSLFQNLFWKDYSYSYSLDYKYSVYSALLTAGLQYKLTDAFNMGVSITSPSMRIAGKGTLHASAVWDDPQSPYPTSVYLDDLDADNGIPAQIKLGFSYNVPKKYGLGIDATYHFAHSYKWLQQDDACFLPDCTDSVTRTHKAVTDFQIGGEYYINNKYPVRAGFFTSFSSAPDADPSYPNELSHIDLYGFTASFGLETDHVVTTLGAQYVFGRGEGVGYKLEGVTDLNPVTASTYEDSIYFSLSTAYIF